MQAVEHNSLLQEHIQLETYAMERENIYRTITLLKLIQNEYSR